MHSTMDTVTEIKSHNDGRPRTKHRREQIIAAAVQLFSGQGYHRTKVQDVARQAGISAGLIYQYVRDKEDLLLLSILDVLDSYAVEIPQAVKGIDDPLERCCAAFRAYCRVIDSRHAATILAYCSSKSLPPERRRVIKDAERQTNQIIIGYIQACIDQGLFRPIDSELVTYQLVMYAHAWALKHWQLSKHFDLESYVKQGLDFFLHAILTEKGWAHLKKYNSEC